MTYLGRRLIIIASTGLWREDLPSLSSIAADNSGTLPDVLSSLPSLAVAAASPARHPQLHWQRQLQVRPIPPNLCCPRSHSPQCPCPLNYSQGHPARAPASPCTASLVISSLRLLYSNRHPSSLRASLQRADAMQHSTDITLANLCSLEASNSRVD